MTNIKKYNLNGVSTVVEFGKKGLRLSSNGSNFSINAQDGSLTNILIKNASSDQDAVAFKQMNDIISTAMERFVSGMVYKGLFDASQPVLPSPINKGDLYKVSVAGTAPGLELSVGDMIVANDTQSSGTTTAQQFDKIDNTESLDTLRAGDIDSTADLTSTTNNIDQKLASRGTIATYVAAELSNAAIQKNYNCNRSQHAALNYDTQPVFNIGEAIPANSTILSAMVKVIQSFNGNSPTLTIGTAGGASSIVESYECDLNTVNTYTILSMTGQSTANQYIGSYSSSGSTSGSASIIIIYKLAMENEIIVDESTQDFQYAPPVITFNY